MFDEMIDNWRGYVEREGYLFTNVTYPANIYDAIHIRNVKNEKIRYRCFPSSEHTLEEHIAYINKMQLEKASIFAGDIGFLNQTPSLKYLTIDLYNDEGQVDYSPIYEMPQIKSLSINDYDFRSLTKAVDYSRIRGLTDLHISGKGHVNFEKIESLKTLSLAGDKSRDLKAVFESKQLDTLLMIQCGLHSLDGIEKSKKMQCVYLHYNHSLRDISALEKVKRTLRALRIENCPAIEDFSVLAELDNLELLELTGKNILPNLQFLKRMKSLKTFVFDMNILDGDLTPCLDLSYVYSGKNRKHYNVKDKDMPKGKYVRGNEDIEMWRRGE